MADYFSKYRGRGGPAIDPGIIQMMGSIGGSYARGIEKFGDEVGSAIAERAERKRQENATEFFLNLSKTTGVADTVAFGEAQDERDQEIASARTGRESKAQGLRDAIAQTGEQGDSGIADEIRDKIDKFQTEIAKIQQNVFLKDKAIDKQEVILGKLPYSDMGNADMVGGSAYTPEQSKNVIRRREINSTIREITKERDRIAKPLPKLQEDVIIANKFWQMESANPGSAKGMNAPKGSDEHQTALERLTFFSGLKDRAETQTKLKREELGPLAAQIDPFIVPTLADALPQMLGDKPEILSRLLNYERPPQKSALVANARNELTRADAVLEDVLGRPKLRVGDFQRPETDIEKVRRLYVDKKKYPKDFGEKVISFLQKTRGPQLRIENLGKYGTWMITNQGAQRVDIDTSEVSPREKHEDARKDIVRKETQANLTIYSDTVKDIETKINTINQKEFDMAEEGLNAEDIRYRKELQEDLIEAKERLKTAQSELRRDEGGDITNPYTDIVVQ